MKISDLLTVRDRIQTAYNTANVSSELNRLIENLANAEQDINLNEYKTEINRLINELKNIESIVATSGQKYQFILDKIKNAVSIEEVKFFNDNYKLEITHNAVNAIRNLRVMPMRQVFINDILNRIRLYSSWQYPALEIGCRDGEWTQHLVASDPLYIVDQYPEFIETTLSHFSPEYQRRLRPYIIKEPNDMLDQLPHEQFGFVFCWNFMNYASLDTIKEYLKIVKELLRPGGVFMFSYNDGDRPAGAAMAENFFMTYVPKHMLIPMAESLGFEVVDQQTRDVSISWIELKRPGTLSTVKAAQVMGEIIHYNI